jgi:hypothetical protein
MRFASGERQVAEVGMDEACDSLPSLSLPFFCSSVLKSSTAEKKRTRLR